MGKSTKSTNMFCIFVEIQSYKKCKEYKPYKKYEKKKLLYFENIKIQKNVKCKNTKTQKTLVHPEIYKNTKIQKKNLHSNNS